MTTDTTLPAGCDCHIHIYDLERYPLEQADPYSPPHATWTDYRALQTKLGLGRCVIVQPMGYRFDNRCTLDALAASQGTARAIVALKPGTDTTELQRLDSLGVVGVRFMMVPNSNNIVTWDMLPAVAREIADLGWHINLQLDGRDLPLYEEMLLSLPCPVVIDHVGKFLEPVTTDHDGYLSLCRLLETRRFWIKLSAMYETSRSGPPDYEDVGALARDLAHRYTHRCLWASNWPHPAQGADKRPDDARLLELLDEWTLSPKARDSILRHNPQAFYRF